MLTWRFLVQGNLTDNMDLGLSVVGERSLCGNLNLNLDTGFDERENHYKLVLNWRHQR